MIALAYFFGAFVGLLIVRAIIRKRGHSKEAVKERIREVFRIIERHTDVLDRCLATATDAMRMAERLNDKRIAQDLAAVLHG